MEPRDLRHLADTYRDAAGLPPCGLEPADFLVLPLADVRQMGVQWQLGEALLFANVGPATRRVGSGSAVGRDDEDDDEDDEDVVQSENIVNLGSDEHGRWSLHINAATGLPTLCLHAPLQTLGPTEFAAAVESFRKRVPIWVMALDEPPIGAEGESTSTSALAPGFELFSRA